MCGEARLGLGNAGASTVFAWPGSPVLESTVLGTVSRLGTGPPLKNSSSPPPRPLEAKPERHRLLSLHSHLSSPSLLATTSSAGPRRDVSCSLSYSCGSPSGHSRISRIPASLTLRLPTPLFRVVCNQSLLPRMTLLFLHPGPLPHMTYLESPAVLFFFFFFFLIFLRSSFLEVSCPFSTLPKEREERTDRRPFPFCLL